jgi:GTP cyclohydrolase IA
MDKEQIVKQMLEAIGEDSTREGLVDTPKRVVRMWDELFRGYKLSPPELTTFNNGDDGIVYDEMVMDAGSFHSFCEHHMLPIVNGWYHFAYIPHSKGKIIGLSKVARVVDYFSSRLQIQERLTHQIVDYIWNTLCNDNKCEYKPIGMGLVMDANHLCKSIRGVKKDGLMRTTKLVGVFKDDDSTRSEFMSWVNRRQIK